MQTSCVRWRQPGAISRAGPRGRASGKEKAEDTASQQRVLREEMAGAQGRGSREMCRAGSPQSELLGRVK